MANPRSAIGAASLACAVVLAAAAPSVAGGYDTGERDWDFLFQPDDFAVEAGQQYEPGVAPLAPGDTIVAYTDGLTEARRGDDYFGEERLLATCAELAGGTAEEIAGGLEARVAAFRRSARDDTAILVARVSPGP